MTWDGDDGPEICALAKLVMPSTPAPTATTRPADTATLVKRDVILIMGSSFGMFTRFPWL
jgi:hypothetical protein